MEERGGDAGRVHHVDVGGLPGGYERDARAQRQSSKREIDLLHRFLQGSLDMRKREREKDKKKKKNRRRKNSVYRRRRVFFLNLSTQAHNQFAA